MRGFGFQEHGGWDRLGTVEVPEPVPGPGEVRVRIRAAAFNRLDLFTLAGIPGVTIERPHVLGSDGAGVVDRRGDGVDDLSDGEAVVINPGLWDGVCLACRAGNEALCPAYRIVGEHTQGTATEFVVVPRRNLQPKPASLSFVEAAAAPLVFQTAWRALRTVGEVRPGARVAVIGAGGGVVPAAVQVATLLGGEVTVAARDEAKAERLRRFGARTIVPIRDDPPLDRALWAASDKRGYDVIFDSVGAPTLPRSIRALARRGRAVVIGATAGPLASIDLRTIFWRQASIRGSTMAGAREYQEMYEHLAGGRLTPVVDSEFPLADAAAALRRFESPDLFGKVVVTVP